MTQWLFAFGAGMLATVNPCGFAMLPAFLAFYLGDSEQGRGGDRVPVPHGWRKGWEWGQR